MICFDYNQMNFKKLIEMIYSSTRSSWLFLHKNVFFIFHVAHNTEPFFVLKLGPQRVTFRGFYQFFCFSELLNSTKVSNIIWTT